MTVLSFFHNSENGDRLYEADDFAKHTSAIIDDGVIEGLKVTYTSAYAYTIDVGKAIVMGRSVLNDAQIATSIATPVNGDLYSVVVRMDLVARAASIETIMGTTYQNDNAVKQIPLATILVGTNTLTITDKRSYASFKSGKLRLDDSQLIYNNLVLDFPAIKFREGSDNTGVGISFGAGGITVIGGGESAHDVLVSPIVTDGNLERMYVTSDYEIQFLVGMQDVKNTPTTGKRAIIASNGDLQIGGNNADANIGVLRYNTTTRTLDLLHWNGSSSLVTTTLNVGDVAYQNTPWLSLSLAGGISDYTAGNNARYKRKGGVVYLNGSVKGITTTGVTIATLPSGYRPIGQAHSFALPTSGKNFARWTIGTDGAIVLENVSQVGNPTATDWFPIHTSFPID